MFNPMFNMKPGVKICPLYKAAKLSDKRCDTSECAMAIGGECPEKVKARALDGILHLMATPSLRKEQKII